MSEVKCYLLHFEPRYRHAQHYLGATRFNDVQDRVDRHLAGRGARIVQYAIAAGCVVTLARVWHNQNWGAETKMKGRSLRPLCPICTPGAAGNW